MKPSDDKPRDKIMPWAHPVRADLALGYIVDANGNYVCPLRATRSDEYNNEIAKALNAYARSSVATNEVTSALVSNGVTKGVPRPTLVPSETLAQYKAFAQKLREGDLFTEPLDWPEISSQVHMAADTIDALADAARSATAALKLTKGEIEAMIDHHDFQESGADSMEMPDSAEYHRKRRAEFKQMLGEYVPSPSPKEKA